MTTLERLKQVIHADRGISPDLIELPTTIASLDLDSLDAVELVMAIEEEFSIEVPDEKQFDTIDDIVKFIEKGI